MSTPKIACICLTYDRPELLARALHCYLQQDYPDDRAELIILDDAGQYSTQEHVDGKPWTLLSIKRRFTSVGAKRNAAIGLVAPDTDAIAIWDDDDVYLPWTLNAHAAALGKGDWSRPSLVADDTVDGYRLWEPNETEWFHASWAFSRDMFWAAGGYPDLPSGEDKKLATKFKDGDVKVVDPIELGFDPYFVFTRSGSSFHISYLQRDQYLKLKSRDLFVEKLLPTPYDALCEQKVKELMVSRRLDDPDSSDVFGKLIGVFGG